MTLGDYIDNFIKEHDLSYESFGKMAGISKQYVGILIRGINNEGKPVSPTVKTYAKIAKATGISELELMLMVNDNVTVNPELSNRELIVVHKFRVADEDRKKAVEDLLDGVSLRKTKIIPLFAAAAGPGEPVSDIGFDDYEVDETEKAQFAVKISGDSMEPELHDGDIVLCRRKKPEIGELAVIMINGFLYVKQYITDGYNIFLRSLNRKRKDCDVDIWASGNDTMVGYGTVIYKKLPLVKQ